MLQWASLLFGMQHAADSTDKGIATCLTNDWSSSLVDARSPKQQSECEVDIAASGTQKNDHATSLIQQIYISIFMLSRFFHFHRRRLARNKQTRAMIQAHILWYMVNMV